MLATAEETYEEASCSMNLSPIAVATTKQAVQQLDQAARAVRRAATPATELTPRADLTSAMSDVLAARNAFRAGEAVAKTADEMTTNLLDEFA